MSSRRALPLPYNAKNQVVKPKGRCITAICASWKVFTCVLSHVMLVTLVVAYCILGAVTFEKLEASNEQNIKKGISSIRNNLTDTIWRITYHDVSVLHEENWTKIVVANLQEFEKTILDKMKKDGWDGIEDQTKLQWTFAGSLFYSIIVITTIGYGHITPKTPLGKVTTIFYAILGIPLMLLCLSNIGDIMASSFRFLYWRVCCFVCTREPKRSQSKRLRRQDTLRTQPSIRYSDRRGNTSLRRSIRISQRTADSGLGTFYEPSLTHAYSDTDLRYLNGPNIGLMNFNEKERNFPKRNGSNQKSNQRFNHRSKGREVFRDRHTVERERNINKQFYNNRFHEDFDTIPPRSKGNSQRGRRAHSMLRDVDENDQMLSNDRDIEMIKYSSKNLYNNTSPKRSKSKQPSLPPSASVYQHPQQQQHLTQQSSQRYNHKRAKSLDPRLYYDQKNDFQFNDDPDDCKLPVLCNRYAIDELDKNTDNNKLQNQRHSNNTLPHQHNMRQRLRQQKQSQQQQQQRSQSMPRPRYREQSELPTRRSLSPQGTPPPITDAPTPHRSYRNNHYQYQSSNEPQPQQHRYSQQSNQSQRPNQYHNHNQLYPPEDEFLDTQPVKKTKRRNRPPPPPSPRIMSPLGFAVHRQARLYYDDDSMYDDEWDQTSGELPARIRPVPIWLCVFLVISYIIAGAFLFSNWEHWSFLDSAYFCFITLTTIGFGDFVPAQRVEKDSEVSIALCSLYLLFGIALLAMSFNLVQEEVIANVKNVARKLGILKNEEFDD